MSVLHFANIQVWQILKQKRATAVLWIGKETVNFLEHCVTACPPHQDV